MDRASACTVEAIVVTILGTLYGIALAVYFVGLIVVGVRMRRGAGVKGFWTNPPDGIGMKAALEAAALGLAWPFTRSRREAWLEQHAPVEDGAWE